MQFKPVGATPAMYADFLEEVKKGRVANSPPSSDCLSRTTVSAGRPVEEHLLIPWELFDWDLKVFYNPENGDITDMNIKRRYKYSDEITQADPPY